MAVAPTTTSQPDDFALMQAIADGDRSALSALYDRHAPIVYALASRILRDRMAAEDLLIDVFWELWRRADRFDSARGSPIGYLLTLARSRAIDRKRSALKRRVVQSHGDLAFETLGNGPQPPTARSSGPLDSAISAELGQRVRAAMNSLDLAQRQAVELSFFDDLSHTQIAEKLGKPLGTVKTHIRQGLIQLRQSMRIKG